MTAAPVAAVPASSTLPAQSGLLFALASAAAFGTSGIFANALLAAGWTPGSAVIVRMLGASLVLAPLALAQLRGRWHLLRRARWRALPFGVFGMAGCQLGFFAAVETVPVSTALLIEYSGVLLVVAWAWAFGGQRPRLRTALGGLGALAGLSLVLGVGGDGFTGGSGLVWAGVAGVCLAVYFVLAAHDGGGVPALALSWVGMLVGAALLGAAALVGLLPMGFSTADATLAGSAVPWWSVVLGMVAIATAFAYSTGIAAARRLSAAPASFVALTEVLFAAAWAWVLLGQHLSTVQLVGGAVVLAGVVVVRSDRRAGASAASAAG
ncbi:EamA/RhaT family transporter [Streptomyces sp. NP160]|uniref:EamA family transporter n=1 Tax=Streptomyces sp. NP160 TaxID=2586637 RepID=UPI0011196F31|nr:DMT family transporter [Streptomyces sp. NP160]TNM61519.1 EamA/RhaT family transporter [Streptomyces sp. NP160]